MRTTSQDTHPTNLTDFFTASEARTDRWRQLSAIGRCWESAAASAQPDEPSYVEAARLFAELSPLESYWAYPGPRLSAAVAEAIEQRNAGVFARLVQKISSTLLTGSYRHENAAWDPLVCGAAGFDGTQFKNLLADRFDVQVNKTSRNSVLVQTNINNTRSDAALLIKVLADLSREIGQRLAQGGSSEQAAFAARVKSLMTDVPDLPNSSRFHNVFRENPKGTTNEGHIRPAFFMTYDESNCEFTPLASREIDDRLKKGPELVSANFVIPYPPGFPIMVPGQVITEETITFMRQLDVKEIHGYHAAHGLKLLKPAALAARKTARSDT